MASDVSVCSQALLRLGAEAISSFSEGSTGPLCKNLFPQIKLNVETVHPWRFNSVKSQLLARTVITPPTQYQFEYVLPPNMLTGMPRTVWNAPFNQGRSTPFTNFNIFEKKLLTSAQQILIDYQVEMVVDVFPPHVVELTIRAVMATIAYAVTDQQAVTDAAFISAWGKPEEEGKGGYAKVAKRIDSQGHPSQSIKSYPLTAVRHGGI